MLLAVSLPPSYEHFKAIFLYSSTELLSYEDVMSALLSKEKFDFEMHLDKNAEGLFIRSGSAKKNSKSRFKGGCNYYHEPEHKFSECHKLKFKKENKEKAQISVEAAFVEIYSDCDVLLATSCEKGSAFE